MNEQDVLIEADRALLAVVNQIRDDQWDMEIPPSFPSANPETTKTLRDVVNAVAYDIAWVPDMLAGKTMDEAGATKFDGDLLGDDPRASFAALVDTTVAAARNLDDLDRTVHCSFGDFPAREYLWQINSYHGFSAYDIAKIIGIDPTLPDPLVQGLWEELPPVVEEWRAMGIFGPKIDVTEDGDLQSRLLGLVGRQP